MTEHGVAAEQLRSLVERVERLNEEGKAINQDKSEVYSEAKGMGFDTKVLRQIIKDRGKDKAEKLEFDSIYDMYASALGMIPATRAGA